MLNRSLKGWIALPLLAASLSACKPENKFMPPPPAEINVGVPLQQQVAPFEVLHVVDQHPHALDRHRVVDRRAHAADRAVALQLHHAALLRPVQEDGIQIRFQKRERDVHARRADRGSLPE